MHGAGPSRPLRELAPGMAESGGGRRGKLSSSSAKRPSSRLDAPYSVTKAAQLSLSRVFADAWSAKGVLVNSVAPGAIEGDSWTASGGLAEQNAARTGATAEQV